MNRRGTSLLFVLIVLTLLGALAGVLFGFLRVSRLGGEGALRAMQVLTAADGEVARVVAQWDARLLDTLAVGGSQAVPSGMSPGGLLLVDTIRRLDATMYLVQVVAEHRRADGTILARDGAERLVTVAAPQAPDSQAVLAVGPLLTEGAPSVSGEDLVPTGWEAVCAAPSGAGAGVRSGASPPVGGTCDSGTCITGQPATARDTSLRVGFLDQLGWVPVADLVLAADKEVAGSGLEVGPSETQGVCDRESGLNWGDPASPASPCGSYLSLVVAQPGTRVEGGIGQGVLLALGSLELAGNFAFKGVVFARGQVTVRDRASVTGTVLSEDTVRVVEAGRIDRSRCAVRRALEAVARPFGGPTRSWSRGP